MENTQNLINSLLLDQVIQDKNNSEDCFNLNQLYDFLKNLLNKCFCQDELSKNELKMFLSIIYNQYINPIEDELLKHYLIIVLHEINNFTSNEIEQCKIQSNDTEDSNLNNQTLLKYLLHDRIYTLFLNNNEE